MLLVMMLPLSLVLIDVALISINRCEMQKIKGYILQNIYDLVYFSIL